MIFGGFIITYNRPEIILETINTVFLQTKSPDFLWIIDNSSSFETDHAVASLLNPRIKYFRMDYNAGPAGAAAKGLELCAGDGADWIYWGDDDDPPEFEDIFEKLLSIRDYDPYCGIIGAVGHFFDHKRGEIKRIQSRLLEKKVSLEVESVAGGMNMLVHRDVIYSGIVPDKDLFFGFEELDFCLKAKRRGFSILVHCQVFLSLRERHNRLNYQRSKYVKKLNPVREYYSLRNLLYISDALTLKTMKRNLIWKWILKSIYGFKYGLRYGVTNGKLIYLAFFHYYSGVKGKTLDL